MNKAQVSEAENLRSNLLGLARRIEQNTIKPEDVVQFLRLYAQEALDIPKAK